MSPASVTRPRSVLESAREKKKQAKEIELLLASEVALWGEVRKELSDFGEKFADKRKTKISHWKVKGIS